MGCLEPLRLGPWARRPCIWPTTKRIKHSARLITARCRDWQCLKCKFGRSKTPWSDLGSGLLLNWRGRGTCHSIEHGPTLKYNVIGKLDSLTHFTGRVYKLGNIGHYADRHYPWASCIIKIIMLAYYQKGQRLLDGVDLCRLQMK